MKAKLLELEASIAQAQRAKSLIEHGLACQHRELFMCPNFRAALKARLVYREARFQGTRRVSSLSNRGETMLDSIESGFYKVKLPRPRAQKIRRAACADLRNHRRSCVPSKRKRCGALAAISWVPLDRSRRELRF